MHSRPTSRSGRRVSLRRERSLAQARARRRNIGVVAFSRLGKTSSPERDVLSLKTGARRLSGSSRNSREGFLILAWARLSSSLHCSDMPTYKFIHNSPTIHIHSFQSSFNHHTRNKVVRSIIYHETRKTVRVLWASTRPRHQSLNTKALRIDSETRKQQKIKGTRLLWNLKGESML